MNLRTRLRSPQPAAASADTPARQAAQDWLPLADLREGCLMRKDDAAIGGLRIQPLSLALKSATEQQVIISAVHAALNGLQVPWQILSLYRPVDLDAYLAALDAQLALMDARRKTVLRDYLTWVHGLVQGGEATERRYHLLVTRTGPDAVREHAQSLPALADDLRRAPGLQVAVMDNAAWRELLFLAFHSGAAAVEAVPDGLRLPPRFIPPIPDNPQEVS